MNEPFPEEIADAQWIEAHRRADAIRRFLRNRPDTRSVSEVLDLAKELGVSKATAYRLVKAFRAGATVTSLVDRKRGRPHGHSVLDDEREEIIRTTINAVFLTRNRPAISELVRKVEEKCIAANLSVPHRRTIVARVKSIDLQKRAKRRGEPRIAKSTEAVPGSLNPSRPLELVQIDHTRADIFVVDRGNPAADRKAMAHARDGRLQPNGHRVLRDNCRLRPGCRPAFACCIPSSTSRPGSGSGRWRNHGPSPVLDTLHVDNGADFRSRAFKRGCEDAELPWNTTPGEPRFGGHIERLIGTQMGRLHLLPGTTFSNPAELGKYDSKRHSALTLRELRRYIASDIVGSYHQSIHRSLGRPPIAVWRDHEGEKIHSACPTLFE